MSESKHFSREDFAAFQNNRMNDTEREMLLEHICSCDFCAELFTSCIEEELVTAPRDMKENILRATKRPDVQLAIRVQETSKRLQLFIYSLKVCTVTVCALLLLIFTMNSSVVSNLLNTPVLISSQTEHESDSKSLPTVIKDGMNKINHSIMDFSNNFINKEVTDHDKKEK